MGKLDHLTNTLANLQLQIMSNDRGKGQIDRESFLLEDPIYGSSSRINTTHMQDSTRMRQIQEQIGQVVHSPLPKLDFPRFDGSNLRGWILKCNSYFKLVPVSSDSHKVTLASMHFDDKAALWYQNYSQKNIELSWAQFVEVLFARFEDIRESKVIDGFNKLKQTGSYADYVDKFEELKACMLLINGEEFSEKYFVASLISSLHKELQSSIAMFEPKTLQHAINLGKKQMIALDALSKKLKPGNTLNKGGGKDIGFGLKMKGKVQNDPTVEKEVMD
ncbi:hypothetical protein ACS0TY_020047 [Phlomoides rotata]